MIKESFKALLQFIKTPSVNSTCSLFTHPVRAREVEITFDSETRQNLRKQIATEHVNAQKESSFSCVAHGFRSYSEFLGSGQ